MIELIDPTLKKLCVINVEVKILRWMKRANEMKKTVGNDIR